MEVQSVTQVTKTDYLVNAQGDSERNEDLI